MFPKDGVYYDLFEKQAHILCEASGLLKKMMNEPQKTEEISLTLKEMEKEADNVGHEVMEHLKRNFITPLEGEDIDLLRQNLDDIIDLIERVANRIVIYNISRPFTEETAEYIEIIHQASKEICAGIKEIKNIKKNRESLHERCKKINDLENIGDEINRKALNKLMNIANPDCVKLVETIKLKEIYEALENAIDSCENIGNLFESLLIKNQ